MLLHIHGKQREDTMTILVPTDFAENAEAIVRYAHALAQGSGETLALMHVVDFTGDDNAWRILYSAPDELEVRARQSAVEKLESLYADVIGDGASFETVVDFGEPADRILDASKRDDISMIVVGTVGESRLQEIFFGHTPSRLVRESSVPVLAVPPSFERVTVQRILAPVDYSDASRKSLLLAAELARSQNAELEVLNAFSPPNPPPFLGLPAVESHSKLEELKQARMRQLSEFIESVGVLDVVNEQWVQANQPAQAIANIGSEREIDLVVMGTAGHKGLKRFFLGSTADRVLRRTHRPVMVLGPGERQ